MNRTRDRGVSITLNYALGLTVGTLLLSGLLFTTGGIIDDRRDATIRAELRVIGQRLAADLATADRLAAAGGSEVSLSSSLPERVGGSTYSIEVDPGASQSRLVLQSAEPLVTVEVPFRNTTHVETGSADGGDLRIVLTADDDLGVRPA